MATRGDVLDRVTDMLEDKTSTTRSRLEPWVGFVLSEMKMAGVLGPDMTTTFATVAGTDSYSLPTDLDHLDQVYIEDNAGEPLVFVAPWKFAEFLADDDDFRGIPEYYTIKKRETLAVTGTLRVYPVPNAVYTVRLNYQGNFATLSADATVLDLSDDNYTTAVWGLYRLWTRVEEEDDILGASQEFRESLKNAKWAQRGRSGRIFVVQSDNI